MAKIQVSNKVISVPPYLTTTWQNVQSMHFEEDGGLLVIALTDGTKVKIPGLDPSVIEKIFEVYAHVIEAKSEQEKPLSAAFQDNMARAFTQLTSLFSSEIPPHFSAAIPLNLNMPQEMGMMMSHHAEQADSPDLPEEVLEKVVKIAHLLSQDGAVQAPEPHPGCNCFHCQIARAIHKGIGDSAESGQEEEQVSAAELTFREWDVHSEGEKLYTVVNPLNPQEKYTVFLGEPLGCTCGHQNCEHIRAVLKSDA